MSRASRRPQRRLGTTALLPVVVFVGCTGDFDATITISDVVPTVATVRWEAPSGSVDEAYVDFGPDEDRALRAPATDDGTGGYEAALVGIEPESRIHARAVVLGEDGIRTSVELSADTGSVPSDLPGFGLDADVLDADAAGDGYLLLTTIPGGASIVATTGNRVWWHGMEYADEFVTTRTRLARDGRSVLYFTWNALPRGGPTSDERNIHRVAFDGSQVESLPVPKAHHDFVELLDGTLATLQFDLLPVEGEEIYGDSIVEIAPDGSETEVWRLWDSLAFSMDDVHEEGTRWGHSNALDYDPDEDVYYVSVLYFDALFKIDRATGDVLWQLGGANSDYLMTTGEDDWFDGQHQFQLLQDGLVLFDNGPHGETDSRIAEYDLDHSAGTAALRWIHQPDPALGVYFYGDVSRLPSGNTLINWSAAGRVEQVTPDGEVVWRIDARLGAGFGYGDLVETLYVE